jgi:hypothetical protein
MTDSELYAHAWRDRQWRRAAIVLWLLLLFPYLWILIWAGKNIFYLFLWLLVGTFLGWRLLVFRCPRCGRFFALSPNIHAYSMKNRPTCLHCGPVVDTVPPAE